MRRSVMPVLVRIHSSFVSTKRVKSSLVRVCSGRYLPMPSILIPIKKLLCVNLSAFGIIMSLLNKHGCNVHRGGCPHRNSPTEILHLSNLKKSIEKSENICYIISMGEINPCSLYYKSFLIFLQRYFSTLTRQNQNIVTLHSLIPIQSLKIIISCIMHRKDVTHYDNFTIFGTGFSV